VLLLVTGAVMMKKILGNEKADKLVRQASATPLLGPEPALGIPTCSARKAINTLSTGGVI